MLISRNWPKREQMTWRDDAALFFDYAHFLYFNCKRRARRCHKRVYSRFQHVIPRHLSKKIRRRDDMRRKDISSLTFYREIHFYVMRFGPYFCPDIILTDCFRRFDDANKSFS